MSVSPVVRLFQSLQQVEIFCQYILSNSRFRLSFNAPQQLYISDSSDR
ncbi:hypothetical protein PEDI_31860 [Persicobacter diffluens]|uniref:Uncharacterized protein n=1 Tax=Persicobacter diffluens TaxID=981 RepID=A0AAN5AKX6_9BACT|nr:hypothetical protein PEDI_31860 [Persicobacter diffluens]